MRKEPSLTQPSGGFFSACKFVRNLAQRCGAFRAVDSGDFSSL
jgi:hypothetical protein